MKQIAQRRFERKRFLGDALVRPLLGGSQFAAHVLDIGQSGVSLFASQFLAVGQPVELVLRLPAGAACPGDLQRDGRVAFARVELDGNIMGIAFARTLSTEDLQALETRLRTREP